MYISPYRLLLTTPFCSLQGLSGLILNVGTWQRSPTVLHYTYYGGVMILELHKLLVLDKVIVIKFPSLYILYILVLSSASFWNSVAMFTEPGGWYLTLAIWD